jgi:tight adherence protein B
MPLDTTIFLGMVFLAVFLMARAFIIPTFSADAQVAKRMQARIQGVVESLDPHAVQLIREKYLRRLSSLERAIEGLPGMKGLALHSEQAGWKLPAYKLVLLSAGLGLGAALVALIAFGEPLFALAAGIPAFAAPLLKLRFDREKRLTAFDEQLPEAIDIMTRALRAGYPFTDALKLVADEGRDPISSELRTTYSDISYGMSQEVAFLSLLERVPSVSLMAMVTAVMIQRETGGNLAEVLDKTAAVVRSRFRFQRRVRTLSAEGRISGWILTLVPFVLAAVLWMTSPDYLPMLTKDAFGRKLIAGAFLLVLCGIYWIRRIIRIEV